MRLDLEFDAKPASRFVGFVFRDQLPFATSQALNDAALAGQKAQREHQRQVFTVRRPSFVDRAVKIKPFAKKRSLEARVLVDPPGGQRRADVLTQHESDPRKQPVEGSSVAVPTAAVKRTATGVIRAADRPRALRERGGRGRGRAKSGGTFLRRDATGRGTIFERTKDGGLRALYQLVPSVDLDQRLKFVQTVGDAAVKAFGPAFDERFAAAVRSAR